MIQKGEEERINVQLYTAFSVSHPESSGVWTEVPPGNTGSAFWTQVFKCEMIVQGFCSCFEPQKNSVLVLGGFSFCHSSFQRSLRQVRELARPRWIIKEYLLNNLFNALPEHCHSWKKMFKKASATFKKYCKTHQIKSQGLLLWKTLPSVCSLFISPMLPKLCCYCVTFQSLLFIQVSV